VCECKTSFSYIVRYKEKVHERYELGIEKKKIVGCLESKEFCDVIETRDAGKRHSLTF